MVAAHEPAPVFVLGTMRSGSTLLRLMLDAHPNIAIGMETAFMRSVESVVQPPAARYGEQWYERYGLDRAALLARIADFYDGIFRAHAQSVGKARWGEKTPAHLWHVEDMAQMYPQARFVAIVRHAGAMATSLNRWVRSFDEHLERWVNENVEIIRTSAILGDRILVVRYEDLVLEPRTVLERVIAHVGEPWSDDVLRYAEVHAARGEHDEVEGGTVPDRPLDATRVWAWLDGADPVVLDAVDRVAGRTLQWLGYAPRAKTLQPFGAGGLTGVEISVRLAESSPGDAAVQTREERDLVLADELDLTRGELQRLRTRRAVRIAVGAADLLKARSLADARAAWSRARGSEVQRSVR